MYGATTATIALEQLVLPAQVIDADNPALTQGGGTPNSAAASPGRYCQAALREVDTRPSVLADAMLCRRQIVAYYTRPCTYARLFARSAGLRQPGASSQRWLHALHACMHEWMHACTQARMHAHAFQDGTHSLPNVQSRRTRVPPAQRFVQAVQFAGLPC